MIFIHLINLLSSLSVFLLAGYIFLKWGKEAWSKTSNYLFVIGIFYLILSILHLVWAVGASEFSKSDFILIKTVFTVAETIIFFIISYDKTLNKNLMYFLVFYLVSIIAITFSFSQFLLIISISSHFFLIIIFLNFVYNFPCLKRAGYAGIFYSFTSILLLTLVLLGIGLASSLFFITSAMLAIVFLYFLYDIRYCRFKFEPSHIKKISLLSFFIKNIILIIAINSLVFISVVGFHELGHAATALCAGCEYSKIIIFGILPSTEILCANKHSAILSALGGILLPLAIGGFIFFSSRPGFIKNMSYLILGFSLLISQEDLMMLGISYNLIITVYALALVVIIFSIIKITLNQLYDEIGQLSLLAPKSLTGYNDEQQSL